MTKKIQNYLCVDVRTEMYDRNLQPGESRTVEATLDIVDATGAPYPDPEGHFTLREVAPKVRKPRPDRRWRLLNRTKHGTAMLNDYHVKVEFYIHHADYQSGRDLADLLAREVETMGEDFCEQPLTPGYAVPFPQKGQGRD